MAKLFRTRFIGAGTTDDPHRPAMADYLPKWARWTIVDLRIEGTGDGQCFIAIEGDDPAIDAAAKAVQAKPVSYEDAAAEIRAKHPRLRDERIHLGA